MRWIAVCDAYGWGTRTWTTRKSCFGGWRSTWSVQKGKKNNQKKASATTPHWIARKAWRMSHDVH